MAILSSTGINGFLCSCKNTGRKLLNQAGELIPEIVEDFVSGFMGTGWKIWKRAGSWILEIDELVVRKTMTVFELLIQKIRAVKGAMAITQANGKVASVTITEEEVLLTIEDEMSFVEHDIVLCQVFTGNNIKRYHVEISKIEGDMIHIPITEFETGENEDGIVVILNSPKIGDDIVQFGNSSKLEQYKGRHSAIYLYSDESGQPAIDLLEDIYSKEWSNCVKTRIGGMIPNSGGKRGFYTVNGMIKGVDDGGSVMYYINPDGEASFGQNGVLFRADKSGYLADGAIKWRWDEGIGKFVTTMGDVILTWDNLSQEAKDNLKGEDGKDGTNGKDGLNGSNGLDGSNGDYILLAYRWSVTRPERPIGAWDIYPRGWAKTPDRENFTISHGSVFTLKDGYYISPVTAYSQISINRMTFSTTTANQVVAIEILASSQPNSDYGIVGLLDSALTANSDYTDRVSGYEKKIVYVNIPYAGSHYIDIGYSKNASGSSNYDNCRYRIIDLQTCWMSQGMVSGITGYSDNWSIPVEFLTDSGYAEQVYIVSDLPDVPRTPSSDPYSDDYVPILTTDDYLTTDVYRAGDVVRSDSKFYRALQASNNKPVTDSVYWKEIPGWTDNPTGVSALAQYEWIAVRKKGVETWGAFSKPSLWATFGQTGLSIVWKGDFPSPPSNPELNWVYRNTVDGMVYIYNGTIWTLMLKDGDDGTDGTDGTNGTDGLSVFITYHDSIEQPVKPTGIGNTGGWHTNPTSAVVWMSQKVSIRADEGQWSDPIRIKGFDANLLPWVENWNSNKTEIGADYVISPKMFSGTRDTVTRKLTGVAFGRDSVEVDGVLKTGIFGIKDGKLTVSVDAETGDAIFEGTVYATDGVFNGTIYADKGIFAGSLITPMKFLSESDVITLIEYSKYKLSNDLNIAVPNGVSTTEIVLPTDIKYNGARAVILSCTWPPFTRSSYGVRITVDTGDGIGNTIDKSIDLLFRAEKTQIEIMGESAKFMAVPYYNYEGSFTKVKWILDL